MYVLGFLGFLAARLDDDISELAVGNSALDVALDVVKQLQHQPQRALALDIVNALGRPLLMDGRANIEQRLTESLVLPELVSFPPHLHFLLVRELRAVKQVIPKFPRNRSH